MKVYKISSLEYANGFCTSDIQVVANTISESEPDIWTVEVVEMTQEELDALP